MINAIFLYRHGANEGAGDVCDVAVAEDDGVCMAVCLVPIDDLTGRSEVTGAILNLHILEDE